MRKFTYIAAIGALLPAMAQAQEMLRLDLPEGEVLVTLQPKSEPPVIARHRDTWVTVQSAYLPLSVAQHANAALLEVYPGGNACPVEYVWLSLDEGKLLATLPFGTCSEGAELVETGSYPALVMDGHENDTGRYRYDFDGYAIRETAVEGESFVSGTLSGSWVIAAVNGRDMIDLLVNAEDYPVVTFTDEGTITGRLPCNRFGGEVIVSGQVVAVSDLVMTEMACVDLAVETEIAEILRDAEYWSELDHGAEIYSPEGRKLLLVRGG